MSPHPSCLESQSPRTKSSLSLASSGTAELHSAPTKETTRLELDSAALRVTAYLGYKRAVDLIFASLLLLAFTPMLVVVGLLVRVTSRGPVIYSQTRLGRDGVPFMIYKFRSMTHNCEQKSGARWATRSDPRVTAVGKFLRITHLDELPQIFNVLKGDMSLVGPRPERPEFIPMLEATLPRYRQRLLVKPGVTGLAQVYLPPDTSIESVRTKLAFDLHYLGILSLSLDLRLMLATGLQAGGVPCKLVRLLLWLPREEAIMPKNNQNDSTASAA